MIIISWVNKPARDGGDASPQREHGGAEGRRGLAGDRVRRPRVLEHIMAKADAPATGNSVRQVRAF